MTLPEAQTYLDADVTTMELVEPPLGRINRETLAYRLGTLS